MKTKQTYKLKDLLKGYYYVNPDITEANFPIPEKIETENWRIIRPSKSFSSQEALDMIKEKGCRPANLYELALFKQNYPKEFILYERILAFGQLWQDSIGRHGVPRVRAYSDGDFRFGLGDFARVWRDYYAFLCFCNLKTSDTKALKKSSDPLSLELRVKKIEDWIDFWETVGTPWNKK